MEKSDVLKKYIETLLTEKEALQSVLAFCKAIEIEEREFYDHFNSLDAIEKEIWVHIFEEIESNLNKEKAYKSGTSREKVLYFYYTFVEILKGYRSYILFKRGKSNPVKATKEIGELSDFKVKFEEWIQMVIEEGLETEEIVNRQRISENYYRVFWGHLLFVLEFWIKDDSRGFEKTDAAIEKSVNLAFELIGRGPLDQAIDFAKFLFQNQKSY